MGYSAAIESGTLLPTMFAPSFREACSPAAQFSPLEWSVVALAERDGLSSLNPPGRLARLFAKFFGEAPAAPLANPKLEALRRISVLSWRQGYTIRASEIQAFVAAGYSLEHYDRLLAKISAGRVKRNGRRAR